MNSETLFYFIQEIDRELELLSSEDFEAEFKPLVRFRNKLILKHKPSPTVNWEIKNKRVLKMIKKANWHLKWASS